jgi:hypothetical protein
VAVSSIPTGTVDVPQIAFTKASPELRARREECRGTLLIPPSLPDPLARCEHRPRQASLLEPHELTGRRRDVPGTQSRQLAQPSL